MAATRAAPFEGSEENEVDEREPESALENRFDDAWSVATLLSMFVRNAALPEEGAGTLPMRSGMTSMANAAKQLAPATKATHGAHRQLSNLEAAMSRIVRPSLAPSRSLGQGLRSR